MRHPFRMLALIALAVAVASAQVDLLTLRESMLLVEHTPDVASSASRGECPQLSAAYIGHEDVGIMARRGCGSQAGTLISQYRVNRRTGVVRVGPDESGAPALSSEGKALSAELVQAAQKRVLSVPESRCLAWVAAKALPGWNENTGSTTIEIGAPDGQFLPVIARRIEAPRPALEMRSLVVDRRMFTVRDEETGLNLASQALGELTSEMLAIRTPATLSDADAISVALRIPTFASSLRSGCKFYAGGVFQSEATQVGTECNGRNAGYAVASVNIRTGRVTEADNGKDLDTPESSALAAELLAAVRSRASYTLRSIQDLCGSAGAQAK